MGVDHLLVDSHDVQPGDAEVRDLLRVDHRMAALGDELRLWAGLDVSGLDRAAWS
jgi:hypothetical protein